MGRALPLLCYCPKSAQQTPFKSPPSTRIERLASVAPTVRSTAVTRASGAPPAAVGGAAFGPTSSDAVSEHGHGHHLFQTESETGAAVARSRAGFSMGGIMHGWQLGLFFSKMKSIDLAKLANLVGRPISLFTEERYRSKMADLARAHAGIQ